MTNMPTATPMASTGPRLLVEFSSATDSVSSATTTVAALAMMAGRRAAARWPSPGGGGRGGAVPPVPRDDQQRVNGARAEDQHLQDAGAEPVDRQAGVGGEEVDHRLGDDQRHRGGDHRQQPQHRAPVGDQQDHDDDGHGRVQQRSGDALEHVVAVGRVPERAGDVRDQAVRVRAGDRVDGIDGLVRVGKALRAQVDLEDGLQGPGRRPTGSGPPPGRARRREPRRTSGRPRPPWPGPRRSGPRRAGTSHHPGVDVGRLEA